MNAVVILRRPRRRGSWRSDRRELFRMREFLEGGEVLVAVDAGERAVLRVGERAWLTAIDVPFSRFASASPWQARQSSLPAA